MKLEYINYYNEISDLNIKEDSLILNCILEAGSFQNIFKEMDSKINPKYFGWNLDAFNDIMCSLSEVKNKNIYIIHDDIQNFSDSDLYNYLDLLKSILMHWKQYNNSKSIYICINVKQEEQINKISTIMLKRKKIADEVHKKLSNLKKDLEKLLEKCANGDQIKLKLSDIKKLENSLYVLK
jgi:hypothetical protein